MPKKGELDGYCYEACALGFNETSCFDMLRIKNLTICNPEKSVIKKAVKNNHLTFVDLNGFKIKKQNLLIKLLLTSLKVEKKSLFNIASFFFNKNKWNIIITGDKELGIDFYLKKINIYVNLNIISRPMENYPFKKPKFIPEEIKMWKNLVNFKKSILIFFTLLVVFLKKKLMMDLDYYLQNFQINCMGR